MSLEIKKIYFTDTELRVALVNFSNLPRHFLRLKDIKKVTISDEGTIKVCFEVDKLLQLENDLINYSSSEVAAALLAFCMITKIPIPRMGTKEIYATDDQVYLKITLKQESKLEEYVIGDQMSNSSVINLKKAQSS